MQPETLPSLLVVDNDQRLHRLYVDIFPQFRVWAVRSGRDALRALAAERQALVLLDLNLPDMNGVVLVTKIRWQGYPVPIIVTGAAITRTDLYLSLKLGADDVVSKPFDVAELQARVEAVLRRSTRPPHVPARVVHFAGLTLGDKGGSALNGCEFHLRPAEHQLLRALVAARGERCLHGDLVEMIGYPAGSIGTDHLIYVTINRLRRRLAALGPYAPRIVNLRGKGYCLVEGDSSL